MIYGANMDSSAGRDTVIVGFDFSGDAMLRGSRLAFQQGLTVLYGLNGTGKSRMLRGIRGALLGVQNDVNVSLIARAVDTSGITEFTRRTRLRWSPSARPLALALAQELADSDDFTASPGRRSAERVLTPEAVSAVIRRHIEERAGDQHPQFRSEVLEDRFFILSPSGTEGSPSWSAYAVADSSRPAATALTLAVADASKSFPDGDLDEDKWAEEFDGYVDRLRAVPVLESAAQAFIAHGPVSRRVQPTSVSLYIANEGDLESGAPITLMGDIDFGLDVLDSERDADEATGDYFSRLVAGVLEDDLRLDEGAEFDGTFPLGKPARLQILWRRLDDAQRVVAQVLLEQTVEAAASQLSQAVSSTLGDVLLDPLVARLEVAPAGLRIGAPSLEWRFHRASQDWVNVDLSGLSKAERQWSERAINEAIYWHQRNNDEQRSDKLRPLVYLLDEPESALHRAAEAFMARSLRERAEDPRRALFVATHSPELLDTTDARLIGLQHTRDHNEASVRDLDLSQRGALNELGLTPSDLLRWPRVILLVEGLHDQVLLDHYLSSRLRAARIDVLVLRGGTRLPLTVDSQVLFEHTEAHVVGLVDNENAENLRTTWERAQAASVQGDTARAIEIVLDGVPRERPESDFVRDWLTKALERGVDGRITPHALERADVIEYLPVSSLVPGATSWEELTSQHRHERETVRGTAKEFKSWLRITRGVEITEESLRHAAAGTPVPRDFERLMKTLEAISARRG